MTINDIRGSVSVVNIIQVLNWIRTSVISAVVITCYWYLFFCSTLLH